ncbi:NADH:flavin oxidoreductase/NADH oxidase family protein [Sandaracinobacteroides hominis]|uniref:NADH:flavin oxidoreductase/NADH oxidase family protein n=1 Tax=Sandaracinobacteroides hominis TaxID=2780086 RepID=UPI001F1A508C|nr:NADH:flavin oxidoreductase/NADH oxidase family protein [Sandaracinobacteroides hominis]
MTSMADPLSLPCGAVIPNRLAKGAMTEGLASPQGIPTLELNRLYKVWSEGGAGMLLTGNVMIDREHLERPGNVILDREPDARMMAALSDWAEAGTVAGNHLWMQISHAGRQTQTNVNPAPKAPSAVALALPGGRFGTPTPLTEPEILDLIGRFATAAMAAKTAGFTGVQVHGAHGYLISQFLSPRSNLREDRWGGTLENRARLLLDAVRAVRAAVGPEFPVSVKLNSADFQRGGFDFGESLQVARWLEEAGVDLLEISGGSYEQPAMMDLQGLEARTDQPQVAASTAAREAYFVDFAKAMQAELKAMKLMVTGGFRSRAAIQHALETGAADLVGLARPLCGEPDGCNRLLAGATQLPRYEAQHALLPRWLSWLQSFEIVRAASGFAVQFWYYAQLDHIGRTGKPQLQQSVFSAVRQVDSQQKHWLAARSG